MISAAMSLTVHNHVDKDSMLHPIRPSPPSRYSRSREGSLTLEYRILSSIYAMHLEDVLGEIDPDCANLHVDGPLM